MPVPRNAALGEASTWLDAVAGRDKQAGVASLESLLAPRSAAVVGAGHRPGSVGRTILLNIRDAGFAGPLYAVSPHGGDIEGIPCVPSVAELPEAPDLAVVAVPAARVVAAAEECGRRGVGSLVVITSDLTPVAGIGPAGGDPAREHAPGRPELLRRRGARDRAGGHVRRTAPFARAYGPGGPVRRGRRGAGGAVLPAGHRDLVFRLRRRQAGRIGQRHAAVVGGGRHHRASGDLPGVLRPPAQVRQDRAPGDGQGSRPDRPRRAVGPGPACRRLAHRGGHRAADHPAGAVRAGGHHRHHRLRRTARRGGADGVPADPGGPGRGHRVQRRRRGRAGRRRVRGGRPGRGHDEPGDPQPPAGGAAGRLSPGGPGGHHGRRQRGGLPRGAARRRRPGRCRRRDRSGGPARPR